MGTSQRGQLPVLLDHVDFLVAAAVARPLHIGVQPYGGVKGVARGLAHERQSHPRLPPPCVLLEQARGIHRARGHVKLHILVALPVGRRAVLRYCLCGEACCVALLPGMTWHDLIVKFWGRVRKRKSPSTTSTFSFVYTPPRWTWCA